MRDRVPFTDGFDGAKPSRGKTRTRHSPYTTPSPHQNAPMTQNTPPSDPLAEPAPQHGCPADADHDREVPEIDLLSPLTIRGVTLRNRIVMSPMCQYSATDGLADDWHLVHLGSRAVGGVGAGDRRGDRRHRATAGSRPATWASGATQHVEPLARIARFVHSQGAVAGIQLAHAGRKASCEPPWKGGASLKTPEAGGWPVVGPSPIPFNEGDPAPRRTRRGRHRRRRRRLRGRRAPAPWRPGSG